MCQSGRQGGGELNQSILIARTWVEKAVSVELCCGVVDAERFALPKVINCRSD